MSSYRSEIPPVGSRASLFGDTTDEQFTATLRYLGSVAHAEATKRRPAKAPAYGAQFVREVMVTGVVTAHEDAVFKEILGAMSRNRISAVPVVDSEHRVVGVVSEADLLARVSGGRIARPRGHRMSWRSESRAKVHATTARDLMTSPAVVTMRDTPISAAVRLAAASRVRRLPVVDSGGRLVGIVSRADLLKPFLRTDEDIREQILREVMVGSFLLHTRSVGLSVREGVVEISGEIERRLVMVSLVRAIRAVPGVVDVDDSRLTYRVDDTISPATKTGPLY
jgi:CBS domain-containing protein